MNSRKPRRRGVVRAVTTRLRGALWPIPVLAVVVAVGIGIGLPGVDGLLESRDSGHPLTFVFGGGPSAARDLLAAIAGSLISVTGLIFSLTVVAFQLGSSQEASWTGEQSRGGTLPPRHARTPSSARGRGPGPTINHDQMLAGFQSGGSTRISCLSRSAARPTPSTELTRVSSCSMLSVPS